VAFCCCKSYGRENFRVLNSFCGRWRSILAVTSVARTELFSVKEWLHRCRRRRNVVIPHSEESLSMTPCHMLAVSEHLGRPYLPAANYLFIRCCCCCCCCNADADDDACARGLDHDPASPHLLNFETSLQWMRHCYSICICSAYIRPVYPVLRPVIMHGDGWMFGPGARGRLSSSGSNISSKFLKHIYLLNRRVIMFSQINYTLALI